MSFMGKLVNVCRRVVDKYDEKHGLRKREVFTCTSKARRNEKRREQFRIAEDLPQCPVYKDDRCCGGCDLAATCDYATNCNCFGFTKGALGGTDEGLYMREDSYAKYGRIGEDGKFDWDYYKWNQDKHTLLGKYVPIRGRLIHSSTEVAEILNGKGLVIGKIVDLIDERKIAVVDFTEDNGGTPITVEIDHRDVRGFDSYKSYEEAKIWVHR